ncbi:MAG TPA: hypothetical protein VGN20_20515 [Mucilaginibacter sp.]|jgi:hypothetical protein
MATKIYSPDFIAGINESLKALQIEASSGKNITVKDIEDLRSYWNAQPVEEKSKNELEKFEVASKTAQIREFNKASKDAIQNATDLMSTLDNLTITLSTLKRSN